MMRPAPATRSLNRRQADAAATDNTDRRPDRNSSGSYRRPKPSGDPAPNRAALRECRGSL